MLEGREQSAAWHIGPSCTHRSTIVATIAGYLRRSQPKKSGTPIRGWAGRLAASACLACAVWCAGSCAGCGACGACAVCAACAACVLRLQRSRKPAAANTGPDHLAHGQRRASGCGHVPCELPGTPLALAQQRGGGRWPVGARAGRAAAAGPRAAAAGGRWRPVQRSPRPRALRWGGGGRSRRRRQRQCHLWLTG